MDFKFLHETSAPLFYDLISFPYNTRFQKLPLIPGTTLDSGTILRNQNRTRVPKLLSMERSENKVCNENTQYSWKSFSSGTQFFNSVLHTIKNNLNWFLSITITSSPLPPRIFPHTQHLKLFIVLGDYIHHSSCNVAFRESNETLHACSTNTVVILNLN